MRKLRDARNSCGRNAASRAEAMKRFGSRLRASCNPRRNHVPLLAPRPAPTSMSPQRPCVRNRRVAILLRLRRKRDPRRTRSRNNPRARSETNRTVSAVGGLPIGIPPISRFGLARTGKKWRLTQPRFEPWSFQFSRAARPKRALPKCQLTRRARGSASSLLFEL
jgi:hypothetical protein